MESPVLERSSKENKASCEADAPRSEAVVTQLARFYSVVGHRPEEAGALALMAEILTQTASDEQIRTSLSRCALECRYPVRLPDLLQRIPGHEVPQPEAEARKAWDIVLQFVGKWVQSDVEGNYIISRGVRWSEPPKLSQRILDTVRRTGGWRAYKCMTVEDFPFQQKRFLEEYEAWTAVEQIMPTNLLTEMPRLQLVAKPMSSTPQLESEVSNAAPPPAIKKVPEPLTETQMRDRAAMQKQALADWQARRQQRSAERPGL